VDALLHCSFLVFFSTLRESVAIDLVPAREQFELGLSCSLEPTSSHSLLARLPLNIPPSDQIKG
jgi:hypothetical protein